MEAELKCLLIFQDGRVCAVCDGQGLRFVNRTLRVRDLACILIIKEGSMRAVEKSFEGVEKLLIISGFDFYSLNLVLGLSVRRESGGGIIDTYKVVLEMLYESVHSAFEVVLGFTGVRCLKIPEVCGSFYLSEIEIDDVSSDQLEGVKYSLKDHGGTGFEILAQGVSIISCKPHQ